MPTITQLPIASGVSAADELPLSQSGATRSVRVDALLASTQPLIAAPTGSLLGRVSLGAGQPEPIAPGAGLALQGPVLSATGTDHLDFTPSSGLQAGDEVVVNSQGQPKRMQATLLRELFIPGAGVTIGADGTISAPGTVGPVGPQGAPGPAGSVSNATPLPSAEGTDHVAVSRSGSDGSVQLGALLASPILAVPGRTVATSVTALAARRFDPRDWGALFDGAHDDAPAIQAALNAAATAGGGVVHLPDTQGGPVLIGSGLIVSASGVRLEGPTPGGVSDNFGDNVLGGLRLVWAGAAGGTMIQIAPATDPVKGQPLIGCGVTGVVLDCRSTAATGLAVLSVRRGTFEAGVVNSTGPGVLCDTVDLGEFNDVQDCVFDLAVSNVATSGACVVLDGTSRGGAWVGNTGINRFRRMRLTYNGGDGLVINNATSNYFEAIAAQHRPGYAAGSQLGSGRGVVLNGPTPGGVGASSNCFEYVNCDVHALAGSVNNQVRWLDVGNGAPVPSIDPAATLYVCTSQLVSSDAAEANLTVADSAGLVETARAARGAEALRVQAASGDHARLVSADGTVEWGLQVAPGGNLQVQPRKGTGQQVSLGAAALSAGGGVMLGDLAAAPSAPSSGIVLYSQSGQLHAVGPAGPMSLGGGGGLLPASAALIGTTASGAGQAITLDPSLTLTGTTLAVAQATPSTLTAVTAINDADKLPIAQGSDDSFDKVATPAQLAAYIGPKILPASAALLGTTSGNAAQAITLSSGLSLSGGVLSVSYSYTLPAATTSMLGGVKPDGTTITISNGVISTTSYTLAAATATALGGVKVPASAALVGSTSGSVLQAIALDPSLTLTGTTLAVAQSAPSTLTAVTAINDADKLPIAQGSDDSFDKVATPAQLAAYVAVKNGSGTSLPASAALIGTTASGAGQAITLGASLVLNGTVLDAQQSAPSTLTAVTAINDADKLPIAQGSDDSFDKVATPAQLAAYIGPKILPASAALLGTTSGNAAQAITLGSGLSLTGTTLSATSAAGPGYSRPALSGFTWVNKGTATATDHTNGPLTITAPPSNGDNIRTLVMVAPSAPYTLTIIVDLFAVAGNSYSVGLVLQNSVSGALALFGKFFNTASNGGALMISHYTNPTTSKSNTTPLSFPPMCGQMAFRAVNDGTNLTYLASRTGFDWLQIAQEAVSVAGSPDQIGFFVNSNDTTSTGLAASIGLLDWEILSTASPNAPATNARM